MHRIFIETLDKREGELDKYLACDGAVKWAGNTEYRYFIERLEKFYIVSRQDRETQLNKYLAHDGTVKGAGNIWHYFIEA